MKYNKNNTVRRPMKVNEKHFNSEWDRIFGNKEDKKKEGDGKVSTG